MFNKLKTHVTILRHTLREKWKGLWGSGTEVPPKSQTQARVLPLPASPAPHKGARKKRADSSKKPAS